MKKKIIIGLVMLIALFPGMKALYAGGCGGNGGGTMAQGGMMGHEGHTMGDEEGMMGQGDMGSHSGHQHSGQQQGQATDLDQARTLMENHLKSTGDPNLRLGEISEERDYFEAEVTTREGSVVDKLRVDKYTGSLESAYQGDSSASEIPEGHQGHVH